MTDVPLFLVDGHNLLYRAWFGFPARILSRDKTRDLTGVFGSLALMRKAHRVHAPDHEIVVVFDAENAADARVAVDTAYKANRAEADHSPIEALSPVQAALDAASVRWLELDGCEADDVIATLTNTATAAGRSVTIYSGDKDFYQLLDDDVTILNPALKTVVAADVTDRCRIQPRQWPDFRALTGDPSDNIAGVRGIGPKTAADLLAGGLLLEDLARHERLRTRRGQALAGQWQQAITWRDMIRLNRDVTVSLDASRGRPTPVLPAAQELVAALGLW